jgi:hypothetical protein
MVVVVMMVVVVVLLAITNNLRVPDTDLSTCQAPIISHLAARRRTVTDYLSAFVPVREEKGSPCSR